MVTMIFLKTLRKKLRRSPVARTFYRGFRDILIFPLRFTKLRTIQLKNFVLKDIFNPKKTSLLATVSPYTQAGYPRLSNIYELSIDVEERNLPGAFVECGTWKGGCAAVMGAIAKRYGSKRNTYYVDSFEGMPAATPEDGPGSERLAGDKLKASVEDVKEIIFDKLDLLPSKNILVKGWFEDSLPKVKKEIGPIAILRLDADWYSSTNTILNELYDQVVRGGYIIFDDYGTWPGCRQAVHEFLDKRQLKPKFIFIGTDDPTAFKKLPPMYFQKS